MMLNSENNPPSIEWTLDQAVIIGYTEKVTQPNELLSLLDIVYNQSLPLTVHSNH